MNIKEKYKGLSFADIAEKIGSKYKNRDNDPIAMRSFKQEINELKNLQEAYRLKEQLKNTTSKQAVNSDNLPMAFNGLDLTKPLEFLTRDVQQFDVDEGNKLFDFRTQDLNKLKLPTLPNITQIQTTTQQGTPTSVPNIVEPTSTATDTSTTTTTDVKKTGKEKLKEFMDNPYAAMTIGKGIEGLGKGLMLAGGYDKFDPITNPNQQEALDLMRSQRVNDEALRNEVIAGREAALANLANVRSTAVQQALQQNVFDTTTTQLGRTELQAQGLRNQLSSQMASALLQTGQQDVAAQERARQLNIASKAGYQQSVQNMLESLGATGQEITQFEQGIATNAFVSSLLATGNFELDTTCLEDYQRGKSVSSNCIKAKADSTTNTGVDRNEMLGSSQQGIESKANGGSLTDPPYSQRDSVSFIADKILQYEQLKGGPGGKPLPSYSNPKYKDMLMNDIYPEIKKILPNASAMEIGEAMDFVFNAGFDTQNKKITKDPRAYALQEYYRKYDKSKLDADGKWAGRKNNAYSFDQEYANTIGKLPENERRILMNKGRDWYYQNINNPSPGVPSPDYYATWHDRIWNTNEFTPFNPNHPNFYKNKSKK